MVKATIEIPKREDRILRILKATYGFKTKEEAVNFIINEYGEKIIERKLKSEFVKKMKKIEKEQGIAFKDINDLRTKIEG
ncbi:DUF2683 family protein [Candidatus Woesearchaeota archaeon]|nr:DUF2683 family protein [Candidatus Woesearchaeota archaeon]